jgi:hypothetical protein
MDPIACYRRIFDAWESSDYAECRQAALDLREWLTRGGFYPPNADRTVVDTVIRAVLEVTSGVQL